VSKENKEEDDTKKENNFISQMSKQKRIHQQVWTWRIHRWLYFYSLISSKLPVASA
jgi:hypothetical protein